MPDGRVIARSAGDTATGSFTCVVRRASFGDCVRYSVDIRNLAASPTDVAVTRAGETLHEMLVLGNSRVTCSYVLPRTNAPLIVNIVCDGTALAVQEDLGVSRLDAQPERARRLIIAGSAITAIGVAGVVTRLALMRRRRLREAELASRTGPPIVAGAVPELDSQVEARAPGGTELEAASSTSIALFELALVAGVPDSDAEREATSGELLDPEPVRVVPLQRTTPLPATRARTRDLSFVTPIAGIAVICLLIAGFVFAHPHVGDLGAPNAVLEGSAIDVPYTSSGIGSLRYAVVSSQGDVIGSGLLAEPQGVLHIAVPAVKHNEAYRIRLVKSGALGDASNEATFGASALPVARVVKRTAPIPMIRSFAISRRTADGRPVIDAFYDVIADSGTLRLVDSRGIQYDVEPLSPTGRTTLALPDSVDPGTLALALHALRNGSAVDSRIALPAGDTDVAVAAPDNASGVTDAPPITVADRAVGGAPIRVKIVHHYPGLHVALLDENARKIVGVDVPRNASTVILHHPPVSGTTRMTVEATYRNNKEADTIVRPVVVIPAGG
jgi:hypothetical protein